MWQYNGEALRYFVTLPLERADGIRAEHGPSAKAGGSIKVTVTVGAARWETSLFPERTLGSYVLPIKKAVR